MRFPSANCLLKHEEKLKHNRPGGSGQSSQDVGNVDKNVETKSFKRNDKISSSTCRKCGDRFANLKDLYSHRMLKHKLSGMTDLQSDPWVNDEETPPWVNEDGSENERLRRAYEHHRHLILRERVREGEVRTTYNFPVTDLININQLIQQIEYIFERSQNAFKVNVSFGLILQHVENGSYRYFSPHYTDSVFLFPQLIHSRSDVESLRNRLAELDIPNYFQKQRPDSKWKPVCVTNVLYNVFKLSFPLGTSKPLPGYITKSKSIISFEKNRNTKRRYDDSLCFFRCLAYHMSRSIHCENLTSDLFAKWLQYVNNKKLKSSDVNLHRMPDLENCFETNINVFELAEDKSVTILYKSMEAYTSEISKTMNLNLFEDHLSYIVKFRSYAKKFQCRMCPRLFDQKCHVIRHEKVCQNSTKIKLPGGYFDQHKSVFDKLLDLGVNVDNKNQFYPWFATYDMEAILKPEVNETESTEHLQKTSRHEPISVSICSNVEGYDKPKFIVDPNVDVLMSEMFSYLNDISAKSYELACKRWSKVFKELDKLEEIWGVPERKKNRSDIGDVCKINQDSNFYDDDDDYYDCDDDDDDLIGNAKESNECEPPSEEFLHAMSKENVFFRTLKHLESADKTSIKKGGLNVEFNDWSDNNDCSSESNCSDSESDLCSSSSSSSSLQPDDDDDDDDDDPFRPLNLTGNTRRIESDDDDDDDDDCYTKSYPQTREIMSKLIRRTRKQFETYCQQIPVLGFNSAKYDLNLLKTKLAKHMNLDRPNQQKFVVKKNNAYMCIANQTIRLLDLVSYLPPGTSYEKFLQTFGVNQRKAFFPYEYFSDTSVLQEPTLPPKEAFYSSLKRFNVLEDAERVKYDRLTITEHKSTEEALSLLGMDTIPESKINENYQAVLKIWDENQMRTFRDYLEYYNNLDVVPMVEGIEKFKMYFTQRGIDIFKECISVPGAARKLLYRSGLQQRASFALLSKQDEDLYHTMKSNIIGGPSIIFTRYHESGRTNIRENENIPCQSVLGFDANSLYLYAIGQPMPCGNYVRRKAENSFKAVKNANRFVDMFSWMDYLNWSKNFNIKHKMNHGYEKRIGPYLVDGFDAISNTVYEYLGCYYHGHHCIKWSDEKVKIERANRTKERLEFIQYHGYNVEVIWECEYNQQIKNNPVLEEFVLKRQPEFFLKNPGKVNNHQIIEGVLNETLFGMIECDIQVPDSWEQVTFKPKTDLTPGEYFEEMSPLFCTTEIDFQAIGLHMQQHIETFGLSKNPRTLLVGGMRGESLLIATPLLKWYIQHGLLITRIYQVVEFSKQACFKDFVETVTEDRRRGDVDSSQELRSTLSKLIGNSAFGGTIINQEKFQRIKYVKGFKKACFAVNNPRFRQINEFGDSMFECEFANANISINSPIYLGYMILQYAKLHMLSFYYDFLDQFVHRNNFEMIEMDTDSCYFALASEMLKDSIKPELKHLYIQSTEDKSICRDNFKGDGFKCIWLPRDCCSRHKKYDSRTPGLMKLEFKGTKMVGLCSKSYIGVNKDLTERSEKVTSVKYSLKGVNKQFYNPINLFERVLNTTETFTAVNKGIRTFNNTVYTYSQQKKAFTYLYCKRVVQLDGIHTKPLNIVLKPINKWKQEQELERAEILTSLLA